MRSSSLLLLLPLLAACARGPESPPRSNEAELSAVDAEVMAVLDELGARFNALDLEGWEATFHFPNVRLMRGTMTVIEAPGMQPFDQIKAGLAAVGWHHTEVDRRKIVYRDGSKAHVEVDFTRYREDGSVIGSYHGLYIITKEDGRWGVKASSFFGF